MILAGRPAKILLIDTNVYFSKRLGDALKREGFEVNCSTQPSFALTTLEYDSPTAIVCSTNMREMGALDIARLVRADAKNSALPIIAIGDGSQRALMEAFQAGCDDYVDRTRPPAVLATHIRNIIISKAEGFQPTQMLTQSDTSLSGSLTHHDLPGVMQMLGHAHQTGALHINSGDTDALLFFDAGTITHAECASLFGDEAVIHILKSCMKNNSGVYKFVYGSASPQRTVLRSATDLMLDAMREIDESARAADSTIAELSALDPSSHADLDRDAQASSDDNSVATLAHDIAADAPGATQENRTASEAPAQAVLGENPALGASTAQDSDHRAITTLIDDFAAAAAAAPFESPHAPELYEQTEPTYQQSEDDLPHRTEPETFRALNRPETAGQEIAESTEQQPHVESAETLPPNQPPVSSQILQNPADPLADPFANYSIVPYPGNDSEELA
jgi:CheY-like chemotaxis protein